MLGAKIRGVGTNIIFIEGVDFLGGGVYSVLPDRIETGTFLVAAAISRGCIVCYSTKSSILKSVLDKLCEAGADIDFGNDWISLDMHGNRPKSVIISTSPYPGFPTDMQSQFGILNCIASGVGVITENVFENRFMYVSELIRMGACVNILNNSVIFYGVDSLFGNTVFATDLRSSASLTLAGCISEGTTVVNCVDYVDRGYDNFEYKLCKIGANIERFYEKKY